MKTTAKTTPNRLPRISANKARRQAMADIKAAGLPNYVQRSTQILNYLRVTKEMEVVI